ncbi:hypothetical protein vseg_004929 [Gypsophila vaccaria]
MEMVQQNEWAEAQKIKFSLDLIEAAKKMLKFLLTVDQHRFLYEDFALQRAIYRYNAFWLPLLAKHVESPVSEGPLVVPLDCEWVWHCHRLNPLRYKMDCLKLFGRFLDNGNVMSTVQATSKSATEKVWGQMYPEEPFELDLTRSYPEEALQTCSQNPKFTTYDLMDAVKRQIRFTYQVSRPHTFDEIFLREAEARYKGFLHLVRMSEKNGTTLHCVPTYDIDLMWHTHQLHPKCYSVDLIEIVGRVLHHDDSIADKSKEKQLEVGSAKTTSHWEDMFGLRYWKAGAMHRGVAPTPVTQAPVLFNNQVEDSSISEKSAVTIQFPALQATEVFLEFVEIKNVPKEYSGTLSVDFRKKQDDRLFKAKRSLSILSESTEKQVAYFQCEATGEFFIELVSNSPSKSTELLGSCSLNLQELLDSRSELSAEKWLSIEPVSSTKCSEPILLHASISFTPPMPVPQMFRLSRSQPMPEARQVMIHTQVVADDGNDVFSLQIGTTIDASTSKTLDLSKEMFCVTSSGEKHKVAEFMGDYWAINGTHGSFKLQHNSGNGDHLFELVGNKMVKLFSGRRLDFEPKNYVNRRHEKDFVTAVEFSKDYPYGRAVALIDLRLETIKVVEEWVVLPSISVAFILSETFKDDMIKNGGTCDEHNMTCAHDGNMLANGGYASHYTRQSASNGDIVGKGDDKATARCWCLADAASTKVNEQCGGSCNQVGARCWCLATAASSGASDKCGDSITNVGARCWCLAEAASSNAGDKCGDFNTNVSAARCWCLAEAASSNAGDKRGDFSINASAARCWCLAEAASSNAGDKCGDFNTKASAARCWCLAEAASSNAGDKRGDFSVNASAARCWCLAEAASSNAGDKCGDFSTKASAARCWCLAEAASSNAGDKCGDFSTKASAARCWCLAEAASSNAGDKRGDFSVNASAARCWCLAEAASSNAGDKCGDFNTKASAARCWCIAEAASSNASDKYGDFNTKASAARCWCIAEATSSNGGDKCGDSITNVGARCWCIAEAASYDASDKCGGQITNVGARCWCIAEAAPSAINQPIAV